VPKDAYALVVFAHGSGSSRLSPRNMLVARALNDRGIATLLFDLLTPAEEIERVNVFNIALLASRLVDVIGWVDSQPELAKLPLGLFGASTGAAAALVAAAKVPQRIGAVISRGGRPDLAADALDDVHAPTLFIVGGDDFGVIDLNEHNAALCLVLSRIYADKDAQEWSHKFKSGQNAWIAPPRAGPAPTPHSPTDV
jgi:pimeloyl-ACP methyl ester carboxylesterase